MKRRISIVLLMATAMFAVSSYGVRLDAQEDDLARVRAGYDVETVDSLERVIAEAESDGVPRELLVEKAVEGAAKRADAPMLVEAVTTWADELRGAVALLGRGTQPQGLAKAAESIRHGVDEEVVRRLAGDYPVDYPIMLQAIEDLLHTGVELDEAQAMVVDAAERGFKGQDVLTLSATLRRLVREGASPVDAAASIRVNMRAGRVTIPPPPPPPGDSRTRTGARLPIPPSPPPPHR
ncbi:MAG: hypothetical protein OEU54_04440 [Gemmatimonadota bacterium]|nr:hypothetical protein [Gemmatimonadota bacterium]